MTAQTHTTPRVDAHRLAVVLAAVVAIIAIVVGALALVSALASDDNPTAPAVPASSTTDQTPGRAGGPDVYERTPTTQQPYWDTAPGR